VLALSKDQWFRLRRGVSRGRSSTDIQGIPGAIPLLFREIHDACRTWGLGGANTHAGLEFQLHVPSKLPVRHVELVAPLNAMA
jgi:hypothetical protein